MLRFALLLIALTLLPRPALAQAPCGGNIMCPLEDRGYYLRAPDGWDGTSPLPVLLHFHGWGRQGKLIVNHRRIAGATRPRGVLLVAPNGRGRTWNFWTANTEDVGFVDRVLADVAKRFPLDPANLFVSGYSFGGAMAWRYTCARGPRIRALLAVSGTIRGGQDCAGPVEARHVHGTSDTVMDYPFGPGGDENGAVFLWRNLNRCGSGPQIVEPWRAVKILGFERRTWTECESGKPVSLDVHRRGHFIPRGWIAAQLDQIMLGKALPQVPSK